MTYMRWKLWMVTALLGATGAAQANTTLQADYSVRWNGFTVATANVSANVTGEDYHILVESSTAGLAKLFVGGHGRLEAAGKHSAGVVASRLYLSEGEWGGESYYRRIEFDADGSVTHMDTKWPEKWLEKYRRIPVPEALRLGPDPLSLVVGLMRQLPAEAVSLQAFDGDSVTEFALECGPNEKFSDDDLADIENISLEGARECTVFAKEIAGERVEAASSSSESRARARRRGVRANAAENDNAIEAEANAPHFRVLMVAQPDIGHIPILLKSRRGMEVHLEKWSANASGEPADDTELAR